MVVAHNVSYGTHTHITQRCIVEGFRCGTDAIAGSELRLGTCPANGANGLLEQN